MVGNTKIMISIYWNVVNLQLDISDVIIII